MPKIEQPRTTLKKHNLAPKKRFGQNFLVHKHTAEEIVKSAYITEKDIVLEVGVGLGALTIPLARYAQHVFGFEIDNGIIRFHEEQGDLPDNVTLVHQDILKTNFNEMHSKCGNDLIIIANLPYSISNPFIFKLLDNAHLIARATIMLQKEVAERLTASPNSKDYGIPTVLLGTCASVNKVMTLKPAEFYPRPQIESIVITIDFSHVPQVIAELPKFDRHLFTRVVRNSFSQRRKTLLNTLSSGGFFMEFSGNDKKLNKDYTLQAIKSVEISPSDRAESLEIPDFVHLSIAFSRLRKKLMLK